MPILFFLTLRLQYDRLLASRQLIGVRSLKSLAADLKISSPTFVRLMDFITQNFSEIEQAKATGDWVPVEDRIFSKYRDYRRMGSFKAMQACIKQGDRPSPLTGKCLKKKRGRPPGKKNKPKSPPKPKPSPSFWATVVGFIRGK